MLVDFLCPILKVNPLDDSDLIRCILNVSLQKSSIILSRLAEIEKFLRSPDRVACIPAQGSKNSLINSESSARLPKIAPLNNKPLCRNYGLVYELGATIESIL